MRSHMAAAPRLTQKQRVACMSTAPQRSAAPATPIGATATATATTATEDDKDPVRTCPWCKTQCLKDAACNHVVCGVNETGALYVGAGCGRSFCFACQKKLCSSLFDPTTGEKLAGGRMHHDAACCAAEPGFVSAEYCPGGHNSHCER